MQRDRQFDVPAKVVVLDGEDVYRPGEGLARRPVLVSFLFQRFDLPGQGGDLVAELQFAVGDTVAGAALGVEQVFQVGVFVGELVAFFRPASSASVTMSSRPDDLRGLPTSSRCIASVMALRSSSLVIAGSARGDDPGLVVPLRDRLQCGDPLPQPLTEWDGGQRAGDLLGELGDLFAELPDVCVRAMFAQANPARHRATPDHSDSKTPGHSADHQR
jgi:hypothetical protein